MSQRIRRVEVPNEFSDSILSDNTVIVILDVYMFSSTVVTLFSHGVEEVIPVYDEDELRFYQEDGLLVGGEHNNLNSEYGGTDFSNSPQNVYATFGVMDEVPSRVALTSNNGARRCVEAVQAVEENDYKNCPILIGSSMNAKSVAEYINSEYPDNEVLLLCAGSKGEASIEDVIGSLAISQYLRGEDVPIPEYEEILSMLPAGQIEAENGFPWLSDEDVLHISTLNKFDIVPQYDFAKEAFYAAHNGDK